MNFDSNSEMIAPIILDEETTLPSIEWRVRLEKAICTVNQQSTGMVEVDDLKNAPNDFFEQMTDEEAAKIRIVGSKIYVRANETNVHRRSVELLNNDIERSAYCRNRGYLLSNKNHFTVVNKFSCGTLTKKIPDSLWGSVDRDEDIPRISLEVAFTHENPLQLYLESIHTLTEYTTMEYAFALKINPSRLNIDFHALFFGMRRTSGNPSSHPRGLAAAVDRIYKDEKTIVGFNCVKEAFDAFPVDDVNAQMNDFGVEVFYTREISEGNYAEDFEVPISPPSDNITIHGVSITFIREYYRLWWRRRNAREAGGN